MEIHDWLTFISVVIGLMGAGCVNFVAFKLFLKQQESLRSSVRKAHDNNTESTKALNALTIRVVKLESDNDTMHELKKTVGGIEKMLNQQNVLLARLCERNKIEIDD